jgi:hypothetical protein
MEALIKALEKRGGSVSISGESTLVAILDARLGFGISEQIARKKAGGGGGGGAASSRKAAPNQRGTETPVRPGIGGRSLKKKHFGP